MIEMLASHKPFVVSNSKGHRMECECGEQGPLRSTLAEAQEDVLAHRG